MTFEDETMDFEDGGGCVPVYTEMICDYCGIKIEWYNAQRDHENPDEEMIQIAKDIDGWVSIDYYKYDGDEEHPDSVCVCSIMKHACPECRTKILKMNEMGDVIE